MLVIFGLFVVRLSSSPLSPSLLLSLHPSSSLSLSSCLTTDLCFALRRGVVRFFTSLDVNFSSGFLLPLVRLLLLVVLVLLTLLLLVRVRDFVLGDVSVSEWLTIPRVTGFLGSSGRSACE